MFVDARSIPNNETLDTDICIIGAGAAGIALAHEFAGQTMRVMLLEAGDFEYAQETQDLNAGENIGLPYFPLAVSRLRYFGGTTNHWGGTCRPFDELDFEARPWVPHSGWPFSKSELDPYYVRAEVLCRLSSHEWSTDYWLAQDRFDPLPLSDERLITRVAQIVKTSNRRFAQSYRDELDRAANITVYLNANLTSLETDEAAGSVTQAHVATLSGNTFVAQAKLFILAAGAVENARLLLLSNQRQPAGLGNQHDLVGRYFMEHPRLVGGIWLPTDSRLAMGLYGLHHAGSTPVKAYIALTAETLRREEMVDVQIDLDPIYAQAYVEASNSEEVAGLKTLLKGLRAGRMPDDFQNHLTHVLSDLMTWHDHAVAMAPLPLPKPEVISRFLQADAAERIELIGDVFGDVALAAYAELSGVIPVEYVEVSTRVEQVPNPDSRVTLSQERDALGLNRAQLDWQLTSLERQSMVRALEIFGAELGRTGLGRLQVKVDRDDASWPEDLRGGWHHIGTTRMHEDPRRGVVDRNCQVHGLSNLFVAGSSVFPTSGSGTPTMTLVSLALRLADHIKARLR